MSGSAINAPGRGSQGAIRAATQTSRSVASTAPVGVLMPVQLRAAVSRKPAMTAEK